MEGRRIRSNRPPVLSLDEREGADIPACSVRGRDRLRSHRERPHDGSGSAREVPGSMQSQAAWERGDGCGVDGGLAGRASGGGRVGTRCDRVVGVHGDGSSRPYLRLEGRSCTSSSTQRGCGLARRHRSGVRSCELATPGRAPLRTAAVVVCAVAHVRWVCSWLRELGEGDVGERRAARARVPRAADGSHARVLLHRTCVAHPPGAPRTQSRRAALRPLTASVSVDIAAGSGAASTPTR
jgi:hypothetical protein